MPRFYYGTDSLSYPLLLILECEHLGGSKSCFPPSLQDLEPYRAYGSIGLVPLFKKREREIRVYSLPLSVSRLSLCTCAEENLCDDTEKRYHL